MFTLTEKLMIYALGRGLEAYDMPVVREIVRDASRQDDRFSSVLLGIVRSVPFQMRKSGKELEPRSDTKMIEEPRRKQDLLEYLLRVLRSLRGLRGFLE